LSGISGEKQGFEEFRKQEMQAREREIKREREPRSMSVFCSAIIRPAGRECGGAGAIILLRFPITNLSPTKLPNRVVRHTLLLLMKDEDEEESLNNLLFVGTRSEL
jgi:hypothetical protein